MENTLKRYFLVIQLTLVVVIALLAGLTVSNVITTFVAPNSSHEFINNG